MRLGIFFYIFLVFSCWQANAAIGVETLVGKVVFEEAFDCKKRGYSRLRCVSSQPKSFTELEKQIVVSTLSKFPQAASKFCQELLKDPRDKIHFYRHTSGYEILGPNRFRRSDVHMAWVDLALPNTVHLSDRFFVLNSRINESYDYKTYLLFHELSHIYDNNNGRISKDLEFLNLYGWHQVETGKTSYVGHSEVAETRWQTRMAGYRKVDGLRDQVMSLFMEGKTELAEKLSLSTAHVLGFPTSYSMTNPHENFAELVTHHFLDPASMQTVPSNVKAWLFDEFGTNTDQP